MNTNKMKPYKIILLVSVVLSAIIHKVDVSLPNYLLYDTGIVDGLLALSKNMLLYVSSLFSFLLLVYASYTSIFRLVEKQQKRLLNK